MVTTKRTKKAKSKPIGRERYHAFRKVHQPKLKAENPSLHHHDLSRELGRMWAQKTEEEKKECLCYYICTTVINIGL
jgi:hypothetical protein